MNTPTHYLLAVDGGGTKTEFFAQCIETGEKISETYGCSNYKSSSPEAAEESILGGFQDFSQKHSIPTAYIKAAVFGFSGCDTEEDLAFYQNTVRQIGLDNSKIRVCNDSEMVLEAVVDEGLCVVAGTGTIAMGLRRDGRKIRVGGWGIPLSDEGSGWWIGAGVLKAYMRWCDALEPEAPVFHKIHAWLRAESPRSGAEKAAALSNREIASLAHCVMDSANEGDALCRELVDKSAGYVAELIVGAYHLLGLTGPTTVITMGSLFRDERYRELVKHKIAVLGIRNLEFNCPNGRPASFGLRLAQKIAYERD